MSSDAIKNLVASIEANLEMALVNAEQLQQHVVSAEGDSDLNRKLAFYLIPALKHWVWGAQAGNVRDLKETLARRLAEKETKMTTSHQGDGQEVLTKPAD
jgi:hypothetical protein